jgi:hypothetical protein
VLVEEGVDNMNTEKTQMNNICQFELLHWVGWGLTLLQPRELFENLLNMMRWVRLIP